MTFYFEKYAFCLLLLFFLRKYFYVNINGDDQLKCLQVDEVELVYYSIIVFLNACKLLLFSLWKRLTRVHELRGARSLSGTAA